MDEVLDFVKKHPILIAGGVGAVILLFFVMSSSGGSSGTAQSSDIGANEASLAGAALSANAQEQLSSSQATAQQNLADTQASYGLSLAQINDNAQTTQDNTAAAVSVDQITAQAQESDESIAASLQSSLAQVGLGADQIQANLAGLESNNQTSTDIANIAAGEQLGIANYTAQTQLGIANIEGQVNIANINAVEGLGITQANDAASAVETSSTNQMISSGISSLAMAFSDDAMKCDKKFIGYENGFKVYTYRYNGSRKVNRGVMASEVVRKRPDAVYNVGGYLMVDYGKIGVYEGLVG